VVEPSPELARAVAVAMRDSGGARFASTPAEAVQALERDESWTGLVITVSSAFSGGFDLVRRVRTQLPIAPLLALTDSAHRDKELASLKSEVQRLPPNPRALWGFARRALSFQRVQAARLSWFLEYARHRESLTPKVTALFAQAIAHSSRGVVAAELGVSQSTLGAQIRMLLTDVSRRDLVSRADDLLDRLLSEDGLRQWDAVSPRWDEADRPPAANLKRATRH
jgi:hypothetical protein